MYIPNTSSYSQVAGSSLSNTSGTNQLHSAKSSTTSLVTTATDDSESLCEEFTERKSESAVDTPLHKAGQIVRRRLTTDDGSWPDSSSAELPKDVKCSNSTSSN